MPPFFCLPGRGPQALWSPVTYVCVLYTHRGRGNGRVAWKRPLPSIPLPYLRPPFSYASTFLPPAEITRALNLTVLSRTLQFITNPDTKQFH